MRFFLALALACTATLAQAVISIKDFGAKPDGKTLNTAALQKALDKAAGQGGGTVEVPAGRYLTGTVFIKSNTTLHLEPGAVLLGSTNLKDYTPLTWGHHEDRTPWHLIVAKDAEHIAITGQGTIDGQGKAFWQPNRPHDWAFYKEIEERPSPMIEIQNCQNVQVSGITITGSAGWTLHLFDSRNVRVDNLRILNTLFGPNTDGIDITGGSQIAITNCIINTGDDAIALKTTEDSGPLEHVSVSNCVLQTSCVAFRVGYESRKDIRFIRLANCTVPTASRIIDIRSFEGAIIEHIDIAGITGTTNSGWPLNRVIEIDLERIDNPYPIAIKEHPNFGKDKPTPKIGAVRHVSIRDLDIVTDGRIMAAAADGAQLEDITFSDISLHYVMLDAPDPLAAKANSIGFFKALPDVRSAPAAVVVKNIKGFHLSGLNVTWPVYPVPQDWHLLTTEWKKLCGDNILGHEEDIRSGKRIPQDFGLLWARNVAGSASLGQNRASNPAMWNTDVKNSELLLAPTEAKTSEAGLRR